MTDNERDKDIVIPAEWDAALNMYQAFVMERSAALEEHLLLAMKETEGDRPEGFPSAVGIAYMGAANFGSFLHTQGYTLTPPS